MKKTRSFTDIKSLILSMFCRKDFTVEEAAFYACKGNIKDHSVVASIKEQEERMNYTGLYFIYKESGIKEVLEIDCYPELQSIVDSLLQKIEIFATPHLEEAIEKEDLKALRGIVENTVPGMFVHKRATEVFNAVGRLKLEEAVGKKAELRKLCRTFFEYSALRRDALLHLVYDDEEKKEKERSERLKSIHTDPALKPDLEMLPKLLGWFVQFLERKEFGIQDKDVAKWMTSRGIMKEKDLSHRNIFVVTHLGKSLAASLSECDLLKRAVMVVESWSDHNSREKMSAKLLDSLLNSGAKTKISTGLNPSISRKFIENLYPENLPEK